MDDFDCTTAGKEIAAFVDELSNWYVRIGAPPLLGGRCGRVRHAAPLPDRDSQSCWRRSFPSWRMRSTATWSAVLTRVRRCPGLGPPLRLPRARRGPGRRRAGGRHGGGAAHRRAGRAARAQAKVKIRQPLRKAVVVASDAGARRDRAARADWSSELNVKEVEFVAEESELVSYRGQAQLPRARPEVRQADAAGRGGRRVAGRGARLAGAGGRRGGRHLDRRPRPLARRPTTCPW